MQMHMEYLYDEYFFYLCLCNEIKDVRVYPQRLIFI